MSGVDPGFFLGGGAQFFFFRLFCRIPVVLESHPVISGGGVAPPPPRSAPQCTICSVVDAWYFHMAMPAKISHYVPIQVTHNSIHFNIAFVIRAVWNKYHACIILAQLVYVPMGIQVLSQCCILIVMLFLSELDLTTSGIWRFSTYGFH